MIAQLLVSRTELITFLLAVFGGSLLVMLKMIANVPVFLLELSDGFFQFSGSCDRFVPLGFRFGKGDSGIFQRPTLLTFFFVKQFYLLFHVLLPRRQLY